VLTYKVTTAFNADATDSEPTSNAPAAMHQRLEVYPGNQLHCDIPNQALSKAYYLQKRKATSKFQYASGFCSFSAANFWIRQLADFDRASVSYHRLNPRPDTWGQ